MNIKKLLEKIDELLFEAEDNGEDEKFEVLTELKEWIIEES